MIEALEIEDPTRTCIPWWPKVAWLQERVEFSPGLNILFGPNGSGKSTVLTTIARVLCCEQGNRQVVTQVAMRRLHKSPLSDDLSLGAYPVHDGSPIMHFAPEKEVGRFANTFDDDFYREGLEYEFLERASQGQITICRIGEHLKTLIAGSFPAVEWRVPPIPEMETLLRGSLPKQRPTLLLDEPTRSFDLPREVKLFQTLPLLAKNVQLIVATHSPYALFGMKDARYIETEPGYVERCREIFRSWIVQNG